MYQAASSTARQVKPAPTIGLRNSDRKLIKIEKSIGLDEGLLNRIASLRAYVCLFRRRDEQNPHG